MERGQKKLMFTWLALLVTFSRSGVQISEDITIVSWFKSYNNFEKLVDVSYLLNCIAGKGLRLQPAVRSRLAYHIILRLIGWLSAWSLRKAF